jgi:type VI secretion system secreted protein Hcp
MPHPARLVVYGPDNKPLPGPIPINDKEHSDLSGGEIHEFGHQVYTIQKDYMYALLYGVDFVRKHEPLTLVKSVDKLSIPLRSYLLSGTFLPKAEIRWYQYLEKERNLAEYFRMTMEHVRLHSILHTLPDIHDPDKERYDHLEKIQFCYQKITWLYNKGTLLFTDIWNGGFYSEVDERDFSGRTDDDEPKEETEPMLVEPLKVTFISGTFEKPENGFSIDQKTRISFNATLSRKPDMKESKVYAKLFATYKGKTEDLRQTQEGRLREDGSWSTEFTLRAPESYQNDSGRSPGASVEFYAEIENSNAVGNYKSETVKAPSKSSSVTTEILLLNEAEEPLQNVSAEILKDGTLFKTVTSNEKGIIEFTVADPEGDYSLNFPEKALAA